MGLSFREWLTERRQRVLAEEKSKKPDYSIDNWIKGVRELGSQVDSLVGQAKQKEVELDQEKNKKSEDPDQEKDDQDQEKFSGEKWERIKSLAKEKAKELSDKKSKKSSGSSEKSPT